MMQNHIGAAWLLLLLPRSQQQQSHQGRSTLQHRQPA
jgi:hypothetical protein